MNSDRSYLKGFFFDHFFVGAVPLVGALSIFLVASGWFDFRVILAADLFFLSYHHVISAYSRIEFQASSAKQNRVLLFYTPILVILAVSILASTLGAWAITTIYLHWQWFHYTRQSEGIAKAYGMKTCSREQGSLLLNRILFYLTPITTFLAMSSRQPDKFLFVDVVTLPVPTAVVDGLGILNSLLFLWWLFQQVRALGKGQLSVLHFTYFLSHHLMFLIAYVLIQDVNLGWLGLNTWHNLQYILFVWVWNNRRYRDGWDPQRPFLSWLSQNHRKALYFATFALLAIVFYESINFVLARALNAESLPIAIVIAYQSINFHHYILDSVIWKLRKKSVRSALGIAA